MSSALKPYSSGRPYTPTKRGALDFLFIHIPRTGGSSIRKALEPYSYIGSEGGHYYITSSNFWPYIGKRFSFCIVRNPWDRLVSAYHLYKKERKPFMEPFKTFKDFALNLCDPPIGHSRPEHCVPQIEQVFDFAGQLAVDFVGRFEYLQEDFDAICQIIGISPERLPVLNGSDHKPYWVYYDDETKEEVYKMFQIDIDFFDYTFGPSDESVGRVDKSDTINWSPLLIEQARDQENSHLDKYRSPRLTDLMVPPEEVEHIRSLEGTPTEAPKKTTLGFDPLQNNRKGHLTKDTKNVPKGGSWQCQEPGCGKITIQPYRWVVGSKTTFACDSCSGKVKEVGAAEITPELEEVIRKMGLLEKQVMALHRRMDDQCGKP